ncbi:germination protein YpeB [Alkalibaculum sp. M08DMB]|uniref:Germination protein YpeB n=1 Tax=Alkalibaculum sporogenes TaxID=2655001 RepID=A0A6A7K5Y7_9FIRM|nr:germination protein YpeB [Alkalibaculum sporogenes]MPW24751.1 germination protein YpeB [Alkalibaculum sporogenes]
MSKNVIIGVLVVALAVAGFIGFQQNEDKTVYRTQLENTYQYNFQALLTTVKNIETNMSKAMISSSDSMSIELLSDVWRQSDLAQNYLSRLPLGHRVLKDTETFLNKLSNFSYAMAKINMNGKKLNDDQQADLERLKNSSTYLLQQLNTMNEQIQQGEVKFSSDDINQAREQLDEASDNLVTKGFTAVDKEMVDYPKLIYDGPFSDHIEDIKPKGLKGDKVTKEDGEEKVKEFMGDEIESIESSEKSEGVITTFMYNLNLKDKEENGYIEISENGGNVLKFMKNRLPDEQKISMEEAQKKADDYLKEIGYVDMVNTYHEKYSNTGVFNYAYSQDDVVVYADLIKIQIALDDGEVLGLEAQGFHMAHHNRKIEEAEITLEDAKENLSTRLEVTSERLALIPTEFETEVLCYEFKGTYKNEMYIIYVNAKTGKEQQILKIIEGDESVLTL